MNWQELVTEILRSGKTQAEIAAAANCTQAFISGLSTGAKKGCQYEIGVVLVRMRDDVRKKQKQAA